MYRVLWRQFYKHTHTDKFTKAEAKNDKTQPLEKSPLVATILTLLKYRPNLSRIKDRPKKERGGKTVFEIP